MPEAGQDLHVPATSPDDFLRFHEAHFSSDALEHFANNFTGAGCTENGANEHVDDDEEEDLGYYDDGVKRTLTDEQIEIFRHSELEQLRKASEKKAAQKASRQARDESESPERDDPSAQNGKKRKRKGKKQPVNPKPDLRKRTWDIVEKGLDTLEYD